MEARSLDSLNLLAANPPQYPEKPSEEIQEPLILYISRVPGTRDIILSPFKPQLKNVTSEDVASSLYYVHFELPPEFPSPSPLRGDGVGSASRGSSPAMAIPRKPVPGSAQALASSSTPENSPRGNQTRRPSNAKDDHSLLPSQRRPSLSVPQRPQKDYGQARPGSPPEALTPPPKLLVSTPDRRLLGPRPTMYPPGQVPGKQQHPPPPQDRFSADDNVRMRSRSSSLMSRSESPSLDRNGRSRSPRKRGEHPTSPFILNLIRRNPGTRAQWNVGKISSHEADSLPGGDDQSYCMYQPTEPSLSPHPPIDIQIEASGYAKFRAMPSKRIMNVGDAHSRRPSMDVAASRRNECGNFFSRQLVMSYSKTWTSNLRTKFQQLEQAARKKKAHGRNWSEVSANSTSSADFAVGSPTSGQPDQQGLKPRGYVFTSPWDGRCEFRTGNGGRSVLCHHMLPTGLATNYNPLVADTPKPAEPVVSELRFSIPGSDLFPSPEGSKDSPKERRLGHFSKFLRPSTPDEDDDDDTVSPFDMNLGGENAGGGNRGKRAKLGKLIIYHEGLKMLDLLVAANLGLWWVTWEKSF